MLAWYNGLDVGQELNQEKEQEQVQVHEQKQEDQFQKEGTSAGNMFARG